MEAEKTGGENVRFQICRLSGFSSENIYFVSLHFRLLNIRRERTFALRTGKFRVDFRIRLSRLW